MYRDKIKTPGEDTLARHYLSRGLMRHPEAAQHVASVQDISDMPLLKLIKLAKKIGVDPDALIDTTEEQDHRQARHSEEHPAFSGTIEFDLTVELFGQRVTRKAKADYTLTPEWEYWDLHKKAPYVGRQGSSMIVKFLTVPEEDGNLGEPDWDEIEGLLNIGQVWNVLEDAIDEKCKIEDAERRQKASSRHTDAKPRSRKLH